MKDLLDWFGLKAFPFGMNLKTQDVLEAEPFNEAMARFDNIKRRGGILFLTGDPGVVKTLAIRRCVDTLIKTLFKRYNTPLTLLNRADPLYHLNRFLGLPPRRFKSVAYGQIQKPPLESKESSGKAVLLIDEPHLIRVEVFAQLHTLLQFDFPLVPLILCGQNTLLDKLMFHSSRPLASCVIGRSHLEGLTLKEMRGYLNHHLKIAGIEEQLFAEEATLAISRDQEACFECRNTSTEGTWTETGYDDSPG